MIGWTDGAVVVMGWDGSCGCFGGCKDTFGRRGVAVFEEYVADSRDSCLWM